MIRWSFLIIPPPSDARDNLPPGCVTVYLEALEHGLRFSLLKVVMEILGTYDIAIAQLVSNTWVLILLFIAPASSNGLSALALTYIHIIQRNSKNCEGKGWYRIIGRSGFLLTLNKPSFIHGFNFWSKRKEGASCQQERRWCDSLEWGPVGSVMYPSGESGTSYSPLLGWTK